VVGELALRVLKCRMTESYDAYHAEQLQLLPNALRDWLPQGHLANCIGDTAKNTKS
jgi:hypothetical protein